MNKYKITGYLVRGNWCGEVLFFHGRPYLRQMENGLTWVHYIKGKRNGQSRENPLCLGTAEDINEMFSVLGSPDEAKEPQPMKVTITIERLKLINKQYKIKQLWKRLPARLLHRR